MKQFDLEAARSGAPVCTRDGRKARIICFDRRDESSPIVALLEGTSTESVLLYSENGHWVGEIGVNSKFDLFMYEKTEPQLKPFDKVLVRDSAETYWRANVFSHMDSNGLFICIGGVWAYCIPYSGNEHLLGTANSPKED